MGYTQQQLDTAEKIKQTNDYKQLKSQWFQDNKIGQMLREKYLSWWFNKNATKPVGNILNQPAEWSWVWWTGISWSTDLNISNVWISNRVWWTGVGWSTDLNTSNVWISNSRDKATVATTSNQVVDWWGINTSSTPLNYTRENYNKILMKDPSKYTDQEKWFMRVLSSSVAEWNTLQTIFWEDWTQSTWVQMPTWVNDLYNKQLQELQDKYTKTQETQKTNQQTQLNDQQTQLNTQEEQQMTNYKQNAEKRITQIHQNLWLSGTSSYATGLIDDINKSIMNQQMTLDLQKQNANDQLKAQILWADSKTLKNIEDQYNKIQEAMIKNQQDISLKVLELNNKTQVDWNKALDNFLTAQWKEYSKMLLDNWIDVAVSGLVHYVSDKYWNQIYNNDWQPLATKWTEQNSNWQPLVIKWTEQDANIIQDRAKAIQQWITTVAQVPNELSNAVIHLLANKSNDTNFDLTPEQEIQSKSIAVQQFWKIRGLKKENLDAVRELMHEGKTANDIQTIFWWRDAKFEWVILDAFDNVSAWFNKDKLDNTQNRLQDKIWQYWVDSPETKSYLLMLVNSQAIGTEKLQADWRIWILNAMGDIKENLKQFKDKWGDTNIFNWTRNNIKNSVGLMGNSELANIWNKIKIAIMTYRQFMSWAAFTVEESKQYADIMPSISDTAPLNLTKLDSFISVIWWFTNTYYRNKMWYWTFDKLYSSWVLPLVAPNLWIKDTNSIDKWWSVNKPTTSWTSSNFNKWTYADLKSKLWKKSVSISVDLNNPLNLTTKDLKQDYVQTKVKESNWTIWTRNFRVFNTPEEWIQASMDDLKGKFSRWMTLWQVVEKWVTGASTNYLNSVSKWLWMVLDKPIKNITQDQLYALVEYMAQQEDKNWNIKKIIEGMRKWWTNTWTWTKENDTNLLDLFK